MIYIISKLFKEQDHEFVNLKWTYVTFPFKGKDFQIGNTVVEFILA